MLLRYSQTSDQPPPSEVGRADEINEYGTPLLVTCNFCRERGFHCIGDLHDRPITCSSCIPNQQVCFGAVARPGRLLDLVDHVNRSVIRMGEFPARWNT